MSKSFDREGWLIKADMSTHKKWRRRYFTLRGRRILYYRSLPGNTPPAGQLTITPESTLTIMENRPRTFSLSLCGNMTLYATAPTAEDLSGWLSAIRTAINVERKIREADLLSDSCSESEEEKEEEEVVPKSRGGWAILEPMKGLFNQLLDQYVVPSSAERRAIDSATSCVHSVPSGRIFGHPLDPSIDVPNIVQQCCDFLLEEEHVKTEGILRVSGHTEVVQKLKQVFEDDVEKKQNLQDALRSIVSNRKFDVFNVGTLLKSFLSAMPESVCQEILSLNTRTYTYAIHKNQVIPRVCYPHLLRAQRMRSTRRKLAVMTAVLNDTLLVPPPHRRCLYFLLKFLQTISEHESENKMSANNLAICFAPTLLRPPSSARTHFNNSHVSSSNLLNDLCTTVDTLKTMITYFQQQDEGCIVLMDTSRSKKMKMSIVARTPSKTTPHMQRKRFLQATPSPSPTIRTRRQSRSVSIPLPTFSSYDNASSVLSVSHMCILKRHACVISLNHSTETTCTQPYDDAQTQVHARGLMDQEPYIMFLQIDTKELYLTKALRRHKISTIQNVDMSETADGSSSLVVEFQDTKKKRLRIRVATATQASEWTTTIVNLIKQEKIQDTNVHVDAQLQGVHKYDEVWIWNEEMISWEKAYLEVSSKHLLWAFHDNTLKTKWTSLQVSKKQNVGRTHSYFTVASSNNKWHVEIRLARNRADMWHNVLMQIGKALEVKPSDEIQRKDKARRRASIGVLRENRDGNDVVKPITFWKSLSKEKWMHDAESENCMLCNSSFHFFLRRHHCRGCGRLVCDRCSQGRVRASKTESAKRACDRCVVTLFGPSVETTLSPTAAAVTSTHDSEIEVNSEEKQRQESERRLKEQLVETARSYEFQIRRQRRALAVYRSSHIERLELKCQDRDTQRRDKIDTPPTTPLMEKIKTAIIARRKISFSTTPKPSGRSISKSSSSSSNGAADGRGPSTIISSPLLLRMR